MILTRNKDLRKSWLSRLFAASFVALLGLRLAAGILSITFPFTTGAYVRA